MIGKHAQNRERFLNCRSRVRFAPGSFYQTAVTTEESAHKGASMVAGAETSSPSNPHAGSRGHAEASGNGSDSAGGGA